MQCVIPPSPAAFVGHHYHKAGVIVNCAEIQRYRDYNCRTLILRKTSHACRLVRVHWDGAKWVITRNVKAYCPHPVIRGAGGLFRVKAR